MTTHTGSAENPTHHLGPTFALLDAERETLLASIMHIPEAERTRRPDPMRWSVAEVIEHLVTVERGIARLIAVRGHDEPPPDAPPAVPLDEARVARLRNRGERIEAPDRVQPRGEMSPDAALGALLETRAALRKALIEANPASLDACTHVHPVLGTLSLRDWAHFVAHHEARHAAQVLEIGEALSR